MDISDFVRRFVENKISLIIAELGVVCGADMGSVNPANLFAVMEDLSVYDLRHGFIVSLYQTLTSNYRARETLFQDFP